MKEKKKMQENWKKKNGKIKKERRMLHRTKVEKVKKNKNQGREKKEIH